MERDKSEGRNSRKLMNMCKMDDERRERTICKYSAPHDGANNNHHFSRHHLHITTPSITTIAILTIRAIKTFLTSLSLTISCHRQRETTIPDKIKIRLYRNTEKDTHDQQIIKKITMTSAAAENKRIAHEKEENKERKLVKCD